MGEMEKGIIKSFNAARKPLPDKVANAPSITLGTELYWEAFLMLGASRVPDGFIPVSEMILYANELGIYDEVDREDFLMIIRELDIKYRELSNKKQKLARDARGKGRSSPAERRAKRKERDGE